MRSGPVAILCLRQILKNRMISKCYRLIQFCLFIAVVLKVQSRGPWRVPSALAESPGCQNDFHNQKRVFVFFTFSHRYRAEFSRGSMTCDDIIVLVDTGMCICVFRFKFFSVLIIFFYWLDHMVQGKGVRESEVWKKNETSTLQESPLMMREGAAVRLVSTLAWRIPGTGEPGGLLSRASHRVGHD